MCAQVKKIDYLPSIINEIWFFTSSGIPIVEFCKTDNINEVLLGGFLSAVKSFSSEMRAGGNLKHFQLKDSKYTCSYCCNKQIMLFCKSPIDAKTKKIKKTLSTIKTIFEELHDPEQLKSWDGDLSVFDSFKKKMELYFKMSNL